jgi:hypothetical protein
MIIKPIPFALEYRITPEGKVFKGDVSLKLQTNGCLRVAIRRKMDKISELVAMVYVPNFDNKTNLIYLDINHRDGNKLNNHVSNLEVISHKENMAHAVNHNLQKRKYPDSTIKDIALMSLNGESWVDIFVYLHNKHGISKTKAYSLINSVVNIPNCYNNICLSVGLVKGSTTSRKT